MCNDKPLLLPIAVDGPHDLVEVGHCEPVNVDRPDLVALHLTQFNILHGCRPLAFVIEATMSVRNFHVSFDVEIMRSTCTLITRLLYVVF